MCNLKMEQINLIFLTFVFLYIFSVLSAKENSLKQYTINKCCLEKEFISELNSDDAIISYCAKLNNLGHKIIDFSDVPLYTRYKKKTGKSVNDVYNLEYGVMLNDTFNKSSPSDYAPFGHNYYLSEEGILFDEDPNQYNWWTEHPKDKFCIDYKLDSNCTVILGSSFWIIFEGDPVGENDIAISINVVGLFISCFFLALTFLVKYLLPDRWGLSELVQMTYVASTFVGYIFLAVILLPGVSYEVKACQGMSYIVYFFIMASFSWMVIMSYDLWRLHRRSNNNCNLNRASRRKQLRRYRLYSAGAWGLPAALTTFLIITNHLDLRHIPWFIKPNIPKYRCMIYGKEQLFYMYIPMTILILINWVFFFLTSYNLWWQYKLTSSLDTNNSNQNNNHRSLRNKLCIYLKLSIVSGISWILEMASSFNPSFDFWYITDCYNALTGLSIFLILTCNKKTFKYLRQRFRQKTNKNYIERTDTEYTTSSKSAN